jgi:hypothetical protein
MTKEQYEQAKALEQKILHITQILEFITENKRIDEAAPNIFIDNEEGDFISLTLGEVDFIQASLESEKCLLEHEFKKL